MKTAKPKTEVKFSKYIVTVARAFTQKGAFKGDYEVRIRAPHVRQVLNEVYRDIDDIVFPETISLVRQSPIYFSGSGWPAERRTARE